MIADGRIKIHQSQEGVTGFDQNSVILGDGTRIEVGVGFEPSPVMAERIMGKEFIAKIDEVGALDEEGERIVVSVNAVWFLGFLLTNFCFSVVATYKSPRILVYDR
jgi:hypothetical protein